MWIERIRLQRELTPVLETPCSDTVTFKILSNINDRAPPRKQPTALTCWLFPEKNPSTDCRLDSKCRSHWRCCKWEVWVDCRCMEFVVVGWCTKKWLRFYQTIRDLTSGDLGIPLVEIWVGVTRLKKTRVKYLLDLFEGRGENWHCDLVCGGYL